MELSTQAGWNQTPEDWRTLIQLDSKGCFGVEVEGRLVATTTLLCYGRLLAWVGMVLTRVEWRGRGVCRGVLGTGHPPARPPRHPHREIGSNHPGPPADGKIGCLGRA